MAWNFLLLTPKYEGDRTICNTGRKLWFSIKKVLTKIKINKYRILWAKHQKQEHRKIVVFDLFVCCERWHVGEIKRVRGVLATFFSSASTAAAAAAVFSIRIGKACTCAVHTHNNVCGLNTDGGLTPRKRLPSHECFYKLLSPAVCRSLWPPLPSEPPAFHRKTNNLKSITWNAAASTEKAFCTTGYDDVDDNLITIISYIRLECGIENLRTTYAGIPRKTGKYIKKKKKLQ